MIFIGIDQAIAKMGVCVLDNNEPLLYLIKPGKLKGTPRLVSLRDQLFNYLLPFKDRITHASLEGPSFGSIGMKDQLGQASAVAQLVLSDLGVKQPLIVPPAILKKFITGNGNATKHQMILFVQQAYKIKINNDDLCDAFGLAQFAKHEHKIAKLCQ